jgi:hypothetical protein
VLFEHTCSVRARTSIGHVFVGHTVHMAAVSGWVDVMSRHCRGYLK